MSKWRVYGTAEVSVSTEVEADTVEEAIEKACEEFSGLTNYAGNGGPDKLIGVCSSEDTVEADGEVTFHTAEEI